MLSSVCKWHLVSHFQMMRSKRGTLYLGICQKAKAAKAESSLHTRNPEEL